MLPSGSALLRSVVINNIREKLVKILVTIFQVSVILKNGAFLWQHQKTKAPLYHSREKATTTPTYDFH